MKGSSEKMQKTQVTIEIERFGTQTPDCNHQKIRFCVDAGNVFEALCAVFYKAIEAMLADSALINQKDEYSRKRDMPEDVQNGPDELPPLPWDDSSTADGLPPLPWYDHSTANEMPRLPWDTNPIAAMLPPVPYSEIVDLYNSICASLPKVNILSDARKKAIKARLNQYCIDDFKRLFKIAESNAFLKGENDRNWKATFDWLVKDSNMAKVLDGNYSYGSQPSGSPHGADGTAHPDGGVWLDGKQVLGVTPK